MAKPVQSTPLMVTIAEKVGTAVGQIVARTAEAVDSAARSLKPAAMVRSGVNRREGSGTPKARSTKRPAAAARKKVVRKRKPAAVKRKRSTK